MLTFWSNWQMVICWNRMIDIIMKIIAKTSKIRLLYLLSNFFSSERGYMLLDTSSIRPNFNRFDWMRYGRLTVKLCKFQNSKFGSQFWSALKLDSCMKAQWLFAASFLLSVAKYMCVWWSSHKFACNLVCFLSIYHALLLLEYPHNRLYCSLGNFE